MNLRSRIGAFSCACVLSFGLLSGCGNREPAGEMRDLTTMELVRDMGLGINLGNTLEACGDWIDSSSITNYETAWGSPEITEEIIAGYAAAGFQSVRIPVAWSNMIADDYTIEATLMERVKTVVDDVLANGMYAVVNIHWDGGWFSGFSTDYEGCLEKYTTIWKQIAEEFQGYSDYLIFESLNEEGCYDDIWNRYSGSDDGKQEAFDILNRINQEFVDLIRSSGGNNETRHLLIAGYATDIWLTCDDCYRMPEDPAGRCAVSVHYYNPPTFCILEEDASWGKARTQWGSKSDKQELEDAMDLMKEHFVDQGIPVIIGEYGCTISNKDTETVRNYLTAVCEAAYTRGMCPMLWDTTDTFYHRTTCQMIDPELESAFRQIAEKENSN